MRIILVDAHQMFREALEIALAEEKQIAVSGVATGREALEVLETHAADLIVTAISLGDTDGISLSREIKRRAIKVPVLILTMHNAPAFVRAAFKVGAQGYALKQQPLDEVLDAITTVAAGRRYVAPTLSSIFPTGSDDMSEETGLLDALSMREREVFSLVVQGQPSRDIARRLSISLKTVETHRSHINRKLGAHSSADLVRLAAITGLLGEDFGPSARARSWRAGHGVHTTNSPTH
jgi:DNA-binding NarL/FixJ family response regulator